MIVSVVRTQDIVRNDGVSKVSQIVCTMHISARQTEGCIMFSKGKYRRRAEKPDNDEDGFCFFCRSVLKINDYFFNTDSGKSGVEPLRPGAAGDGSMGLYWFRVQHWQSDGCRDEQRYEQPYAGR